MGQGVEDVEQGVVLAQPTPTGCAFWAWWFHGCLGPMRHGRHGLDDEWLRRHDMLSWIRGISTQAFAPKPTGLQPLHTAALPLLPACIP